VRRPNLLSTLRHSRGVAARRRLHRCPLSTGDADTAVRIARGELDFDYNTTLAHVLSIEKGVPIKVLAGMHSGCVELIARESIQRVTDLKGKRVGIDSLTSYPELVMVLEAAYVGVDPVKSSGSRIQALRQYNFSLTERSMHSSPFRPCRRNPGPEKSATPFSARSSTAISWQACRQPVPRASLAVEDRWPTSHRQR
jgi:hypothetical protein